MLASTRLALLGRHRSPLVPSASRYRSLSGGTAPESEPRREGQGQQQQQQQQPGASTAPGQRRRSLNLGGEQTRRLWEQLGWEKGYRRGGGGGTGRGSDPRRRGRLRVDPDRFPLELFGDAPVIDGVGLDDDARRVDDAGADDAVGANEAEEAAQTDREACAAADERSSDGGIARDGSEAAAERSSPEVLRRLAVEAEAELDDALLRLRDHPSSSSSSSSSSDDDGRKALRDAYDAALDAWSRYQKSLVETAKRRIAEARAEEMDGAPAPDLAPSGAAEVRSELRRTARRVAALLRRWEEEEGGPPPPVGAYRAAIEAWDAVHQHVKRYPALEGGGEDPTAGGGGGGGNGTGGAAAATHGRYGAAEGATEVLRGMMERLAAPSHRADGRDGLGEVDYRASLPPSVEIGRACARVIRMWTDDVVGGQMRRRRRGGSGDAAAAVEAEAKAALLAARRAADLLEEGERRRSDAVLDAGVGAYNAVLSAYSRAASALSRAVEPGGRDGNASLARLAAEEAEHILSRMEDGGGRSSGGESSHDDGDDAAEPSATGGDVHGAKHRCGRSRPNLSSYRAVLTAWAALGTPAGAYRAEQILRRAEESVGSGGAHVTVAFYSTVLNAFARVAHLDRGQAAGKALEILARLEGEADARSLLRTFDGMAGLAEDGDIEARLGHNSSLEETGNPSSGSNIATVRPNSICYSAALNAVVRMRTATSWKLIRDESSPQERARFAQAILARMEQAHSLGHIDAPQLHNYGRVITAWSKNDNINLAAAQAEAVLKRMEVRLLTVQNNEADSSASSLNDSLVASVTVWYNSVISLLAKSTVPDAAQRAEDILGRMENIYMHQCHDYQQSASCHRTPLVEVNGHQSEPRIPTNVLVVPDFRSYQACISAWANSVEVQDVTRAIHARDILQKMEFVYKVGNMLARPHVTCYNAAIKSCALVTKGGDVGKRAALAIAKGVYEDLCKCTYDKPNAATYGRMIEAYSKLLLPGTERYESIEAVFRECCVQGQVSAFVLKMVQLGASREVVRNLVRSRIASSPETKKLVPSDLPSAWTKNVAAMPARR